MQENEFRKKVQQKMAGLKLSPSPAIWQNIDKEINVKNKSKRWGLFIIIAFIFLGGGFLLWEHTQFSELNHHSFTKNLTKPKTFPQHNSNLSLIVPSENNELYIPVKKQHSKKIKSSKDNSTSKIANQENNEIPEQPLSNSLYIQPLKTIIVTQKIAYAEKLKLQESTASEFKVKKAVKSAQKNKWAFGLNFSAGLLKTETGFAGLSANYMSPGPGGMQGSNNPFVATSRLGFSIGIVALKNIYKKNRLAVGFNYKLLSTKIATGEKVYSTIDIPKVDNVNPGITVTQYYKNDNTKYYNNYYHFVELPIQLQSPISKSLYWSSGITLSQLITTNTLQYDHMTNVYYKDNRLFKKSQVLLSAGIFIKLPYNKKSSISIGPKFDYGLTKMANYGIYQNKHYTYFGLHIQKVFEKK